MRTEALQDDRLTAIVAAWPDLSESARQALADHAVSLAAAAYTDTPEHPTRLSCTAGERSNARQGVQCEFDCGADESGFDCTDDAGSPSASGSAAADGDSGEDQS